MSTYRSWTDHRSQVTANVISTCMGDCLGTLNTTCCRPFLYPYFACRPFLCKSVRVNYDKLSTDIFLKIINSRSLRKPKMSAYTIQAYTTRSYYYNAVHIESLSRFQSTITRGKVKLTATCICACVALSVIITI